MRSAFLRASLHANPAAIRRNYAIVAIHLRSSAGPLPRLRPKTRVCTVSLRSAICKHPYTHSRTGCKYHLRYQRFTVRFGFGNRIAL